jgi:hypothetical protein
MELDDGRYVGVEIKYRMNWDKACQACHQLAWYVERVQPTGSVQLDAGIVIFEEFSGDWARRSPSRLLENGWNYWYTDHHQVGGLRLDLMRVRDDTIETYPAALSTARALNAS